MDINKLINSVQTTDRFIATPGSHIHISCFSGACSHRSFTDPSPPPLLNLSDSPELSCLVPSQQQSWPPSSSLLPGSSPPAAAVAPPASRPGSSSTPFPSYRTPPRVRLRPACSSGCTVLSDPVVPASRAVLLPLRRSRWVCSGSAAEAVET